jgi:PAS domain S-box-containing protein
MVIGRLADRVIVDVNPAFESLLGWPRAEAVGQTTAALGILDEDSVGLLRARLLEQGAVRDLEFTVRTRRGEMRRLLIAAEAVTLSGEPHGVFTFVDVTASRATEDAARLTEERLQIVADHASDVIVQIDVHSTVRMVNRAVEAMFGYGVGELVGESLTLLMPESSREAHIDGLARYLATGQRHTSWTALELVGRKKSGEEFPIEVSFGEYAADGETLFSGVIRDITDRKHAELQIARLNRMHAVLSGISEAVVRASSPQQLFDTACAIAVERGAFRMAWIGRLDDQGGFRVVAQAGALPGTMAIVRALLEASPEPQCAQTLRALRTGRRAVCNDIVGDPSTAPWRGPALERGYRAMAAFPLVVDGASVGTFNLYAADVGFFDAAELALLEQVAADIAFCLEAERREALRRDAESALRASEERFREIAETIQEVFWMTDASGGRVLYVSPAYEAIWGRTREALYSDVRAWVESLHADDRDRVLRAVTPGQFGDAFEIEYRILRPDDEVRWIRDLGFAVRGADGQIERVVGVAADITDRKAVEAQMREAQKMESVGRLAAGLAHDLNNVLTVITGIAELAMTDPTASPMLAEHLATIKAAGERAAAVTRQLLAFGRKQVLRPTVINLNVLVREAEPLIRRLLGDQLRLVLSLAPDLGSVRVDAGQFHQVILNLVVNSRDAMPQGGTLTMRTESVLRDGRSRLTPTVAPGHYAVLHIDDTGEGMDSATQQRMFEPFFTTKPPERGTGLGLSTVHGIVKQSGGDIEVRSELGRGTTMSIWLPVVDADRAAALEPERKRGQECILVVDDDAGVRLLTQRILERSGYVVRTASGGAEALEILAAGEPIDLVLSDVVMPGMSGRELAEAIWRRKPAMRVVFMTGYTEDAILRHGVLERGLHLIGKPYTVAQLTSKIREVLES